MRRLVLLAVIASPATALAQQSPPGPPSQVPVVEDEEVPESGRPPAYFATGTSVSHDAHTNASVFVEGGMRVANTALWVHGLIGTGAALQVEGEEHFLEGRGGIEVSCSRRQAVCGFFGIDVGGEVQRHRSGGDKDKKVGFIAVPRFGFDVGGALVRLRASIDGRWFRYAAKTDPLGGTSTGGGVSVAVALRF